jgi:phosphoglycolate phosphatase-like HAD superfamily hydrolase
MQQAILFDLDDTLIDTHQRHFSVFSDFLKSKNSGEISFEEYLLQRKKKSFSNKILLQNLFPKHENDFQEFFANTIESPEYLKFDKPIINDDLLKKVKLKGIKMFVLSLRSKEENAMQQVKQFSFYNLIDDFIFIKHKTGINEKAERINSLKLNHNIKVFIGDSDYDKEAASIAAVDFCAVKTGMYSISHPVIFEDVNIALQQILK